MKKLFNQIYMLYEFCYSTDYWNFSESRARTDNFLWYSLILSGLLERDSDMSLKLVSEVGFEPTPTFVDQNTLARIIREGN